MSAEMALPLSERSSSGLLARSCGRHRCHHSRVHKSTFELLPVSLRRMARVGATRRTHHFQRTRFSSSIPRRGIRIRTQRKCGVPDATHPFRPQRRRCRCRGKSGHLQPSSWILQKIRSRSNCPQRFRVRRSVTPRMVLGPPRIPGCFTPAPSR